jgi:hypothetical protein
MDRINADTTARAAGISVGTLNVWIQRRLVPDVSVSASGKRRVFSIDDVMFISIMAALVRLGMASPLASEHAKCAREHLHEPNAVLTIAASEEKGLSGVHWDSHCLSGDTLNPKDWLKGFYERPEAYVTVEVFRVMERVKKFLAAEGESEPAIAEEIPPTVDVGDEGA